MGGNGRIPMGDLELEMEEVEGLVSVSITSPKSQSKTAAFTNSRIDPSSQSRVPWYRSSRALILLAVFAIAAATGLLMDTKDNSELKEEAAQLEAGTVQEKPATAAESVEGTSAEKREKETLGEKWGRWHFWDGAKETRPSDDYCASYPNRDIPEQDFPPNAWQTDAVYVNHFLDAATDLLSRAKEAIYTEYGHGKEGMTDTSAEMMERSKMFRRYEVDFEKDSPPVEAAEGGGWTTKQSFDGLVKRLLHAMMSNDTFTVVLGGHSAAAGHGNHFLQSYTMQFHKIMKPIFDRLGVKLITRNLAHGGLGTFQSALGSGSIYGEDVDMILWDSGMTEKKDADIDLFCRQAILGGKRAPVLWGGSYKVLRTLYQHVDADVMQFGNAKVGLPITISETQALELPWAARYMQCDSQREDLCTTKEHKFRTQCWVERKDVTPQMAQDKYPKSQLGWHPGFRAHQLVGRVLAFTILDALQNAVNTWNEITMRYGHPLPDKYWHITEHWNNIRNKTLGLDPSIGYCFELRDSLPERVCKTPMQARTEFTPRANPELTSITGIIQPTLDGYVPKNKAVLAYDGPDVLNPALMVPDGEFDISAVISNRRVLPVQLSSLETKHDKTENADQLLVNVSRSRRRANDPIVPGKGWELNGVPPGYCDGTATSICGRDSTSTCLLSGHMDARGGILGNEFSGWLVMNLKDVKEGIVILKLETWHTPPESLLTQGWITANNETRNLEELPDTFQFEYAINGERTTLPKEQFLEKKTKPQRVVELLTILDDEYMLTKNGGEAMNVEVAFRMKNCGRDCTFKLTHVYWA